MQFKKALRTLGLSSSVWFGPLNSRRPSLALDTAFAQPDLREVVLELYSDGLGDVINLVVLIQEIAARAPQAQIVVVTNHSKIPFHFCAQNVRTVSSLPERPKTSATSTVYVNLTDNVRYHLYCPHWLQYLLIAGLGTYTRQNDPFPFLNPAAFSDFAARLLQIQQGRPLVLFHMQNVRTDWAGRNTHLQNLLETARAVQTAGYAVVEVGNDNSPTGEFPHLAPLRIEELIYAMRVGSGFVGIDSFPMHVAALYDKPILGFFAATYPDVVLPPVSRLITLRDEELRCNGCVYMTRPVSYNRCILGTQACQRRLPTEYLLERQQQFLNLLAHPEATVPGPSAAQLEHMLRMAQLLFEQTLVLERFPLGGFVSASLRRKIRTLIAAD